MLTKLKQLSTKGFTHTNSRKSLGGFTIIEVLIVLAIAGLILLIVFLAVPALQRNSRNTQRRSDVAKVLAAAQEWTNNNNGTWPATGQFSTVFTGVTPNFAIYQTAANIQWVYSATVPGTAHADPADIAKVTLVNFHVCNANGTAPTTTGATVRSIVALWDLESSAGSTGGTAQCTSS